MNDKPSTPEPSGAGLELDPEVQALLDGLDSTPGEPEAPAAGQIEAAPGSTTVAVAEREAQAPAPDEAKPVFRAPGNIRREHWWYMPFFGMLGALMVASAALTPSLLPRGGAVQGLVSGVGAALGYGVGLFILWLLRQFTRPHGHTVGQPRAIAPAERHLHPASRFDLGRELRRHQVVKRFIDTLRQYHRRHHSLPDVVLLPVGPTANEFALRAGTSGRRKRTTGR